MLKSFWLINPNRSYVKRFTKNQKNEDKFFEYIFIDDGKVISIFGKEPPLMKNREEVKIDEARKIWNRLVLQGWRRTKPIWENN
tara:strand:+ start:339 stop:590 length:252 start_codon:yes stop_codon:yes gene_type:complete